MGNFWNHLADIWNHLDHFWNHLGHFFLHHLGTLLPTKRERTVYLNIANIGPCRVSSSVTKCWNKNVTKMYPKVAKIIPTASFYTNWSKLIYLKLAQKSLIFLGSFCNHIFSKNRLFWSHCKRRKKTPKVDSISLFHNL